MKPATVLRRRRLWGTVFLLLSAVIIFIFSNGKEDTPSFAKTSQKSSVTTDPPKTVHPALSEEFSTVLLNGMVVSHESAEVHARREGIVQDVFVDLGDSVTEGQVLAALLPRGVEGESAALIAQKSAESAKARIEYENSLLIEQETISNAEAMVKEKETLFSSALSTKDSKEGKAAEDVETASAVTLAMKNDAQQSVRAAEENLRVSEENLKKASENAESQKNKSGATIEEASNQSEIAIRHALQIANQVIFDQDRDDLIQVQDIPYYFGFDDPQSKTDFTKAVAELQNYNDEENLTEKITLAENMLSYLNTILAGSISGSHLTQSDIDSKIQTVHSAEDKLALAKEKYRLSQNSKETVYTEQEKEITRLEGLVAQNKESLKSAESRLALIDSQSDQSSQKAKSEEDTVIATESEKIKSIKEQIEVARENVNVVKAAQKRNVDAAKNLLDVANAALSTELSKSGHIEIVSPFTGTVVRRNVAVGDVIGVEKAAFELVEVSSELSEEAQTTIHFGIPEHLAKNILPGTKVEVSLFQGTLSNVWKEAVITRRSEVVDSQTRLVEAQAELVENITLPHNATVRVRLITSDPPIWKVRSSMVKREEGKNFLWVLSSSAHKEPSSEKNDSPQEEVSGATKIPVEVFSEDGEWAHVIGDISETTEILLSPPENFYEYD